MGSGSVVGAVLVSGEVELLEEELLEEELLEEELLEEEPPVDPELPLSPEALSLVVVWLSQ